jgi:hypothetical protein
MLRKPNKMTALFNLGQILLKSRWGLPTIRPARILDIEPNGPLVPDYPWSREMIRKDHYDPDDCGPAVSCEPGMTPEI